MEGNVLLNDNLRKKLSNYINLNYSNRSGVNLSFSKIINYGYGFQTMPIAIGIVFDSDGIVHVCVCVKSIFQEMHLIALIGAIKNFINNEVHSELRSLGDFSYQTGSSGIKNKIDPSISSRKISLAPVVDILLFEIDPQYPIDLINEKISLNGLMARLIDGEKMYHSVFISYGSPDEERVRSINQYLKDKGVRTWFFPENSVPGKKLHRTMNEGVADHDKVLLICSESSLNRNGVLSEIEYVLEKEASNAGDSILIPIALDNYIFKWKPEKFEDRATQIRARVIQEMPDENDKIILNKILNALKI